MNTTSSSAALAAALQRNERLLQSADALDCALQGFTKIAPTATAGQSVQAAQLASLFDFADLDSAVYGGPTATSTELPSSSSSSAALFDDWLANDLNQVHNSFASFVGADSFADMPAYPSSSSGSDVSGDSPQLLTSGSCSPALGFESLLATGTSGTSFDAMSSLFPEAAQLQTPAEVLPAIAPIAAPSAVVSAEAAQQAAAALNIPWSKSLEQAILAQSILAALNKPAAAAAPALLPKSPSPSASDRDQSRTPSLPPSTPRMSLSILPSTKVPVPGTHNVTATTYKSVYRTAPTTTTVSRGLLKREREVSEPPSVLDGKDVTQMDEVALKRAKNTDAARRSRHKKQVMVDGLEQRVAELEVENSMFESKLNEVEIERSLLADKDQMQQARIKELEMMLASVRDKLL
ncbi:hypothetical protein BGZ83_000674 [Gryganskiella cystojenkinii]|nr:hypothetical protein BGZ83_000674 [Gryganskiella cystojenkinii]